MAINRRRASSPAWLCTACFRGRTNQGPKYGMQKLAGPVQPGVLSEGEGGGEAHAASCSSMATVISFAMPRAMVCALAIAGMPVVMGDPVVRRLNFDEPFEVVICALVRFQVCPLRRAIRMLNCRSMSAVTR